MIQPSALLTQGLENPRKTADFTVLEGAFEQLLSADGAGEALPGGKILPDGGKDLPEGLPTIDLPRLASRKLFARLDTTEPTPESGKVAVDAKAKLAEPASEDDREPAEPTVDQPSPDAEPEVILDLRITPLSVASVAAAPAEPTETDVSNDDALAAPRRMIAHRPIQPGLPQVEAPSVAEKSAPPVKAEPQPAVALVLPMTSKAPRAPVLDPKVSINGERPADAPQPARIAPGQQNEPVRELKLQPSADSQADADTHGSGERRTAAPATAPAMHVAASVEPVQTGTVDIASAQPVLREAAHSAAPHQIQDVRPQDLTALVDRLVEARESARSTNANLTVMHADFGRVSLHFAHDNGNLTVSLANNDPGFVRAVNEAVAPDAGMNHDAQPQGDRRGDGGHNASARAPLTDHGSTGDRSGQPRNERNDRGGFAANPSHREAREAHSGKRGIFA